VAAVPLLERYGAAIRRRRVRLGLSQESLAFEAGIHRTYISMLERGRANPSLTVVDSVASALGCEISAIFKEMERAAHD